LDEPATPVQSPSGVRNRRKVPAASAEECAAVAADAQRAALVDGARIVR